ncbi:MAG: hypothetical protein Q8830_03925, partial [Candidatus Phytoplasma australasiaticum]|nr:hypothetical protein [Candidatus Phytoplasma australasiaticum]
HLQDQGKLVHTLNGKKIHTTIYDNSVCQKAYYSRFRIFIKESHLCAGSSEGGRGTCHVSFETKV